MKFSMERHYFVHALSGAMRLEADGNRWTLPPARGALIAAGHSVEITVLTPVTSASVLFAPDFMTPRSSLVVFDISPLCGELVRAAGQWGQWDEQDDYGRQLFRMLSAEIGRLEQAPSPCVLKTPKDKYLAKAVALTEASLGEDISFEEIARTVACSPRTLARRFSDEMGLTWRETLRRLRITRAMELLAMTESNVTEISLVVGYASLSSFNTAFRQIAGMTPTAYRKALSH